MCRDDRLERGVFAHGSCVLSDRTHERRIMTAIIFAKPRHEYANTGETWYNCSIENVPALLVTAGNMSHLQPTEGCVMTDSNSTSISHVFPNGAATLIDTADADLLAHRWYVSANNYVRHNISARTANRLGIPHTWHLHRMVLERKLSRALTPTEYVDHVNGNRLDNRRVNLRVASKLENARNCKRYKNNSSGYKGVRFAKKHQKWQARIRVEGKLLHLGLADTPEAAYEIYKEAAQLYFGEFARNE